MPSVRFCLVIVSKVVLYSSLRVLCSGCVVRHIMVADSSIGLGEETYHNRWCGKEDRHNVKQREIEIKGGRRKERLR